ncbi:hypothetical protein [Herbaspirillum sp. SJZ099]|uniref:hypothetical protein n=1 Tax=Herbaspirillum sp. SJZ099 TaxID=2572916 RepID=UPI0011A13E3A|nr:hypothetical protein [Herbaspirillum sp. SJZ099]
MPTNSSDGSVELGSEVKLKWKRVRGFHFCFPPSVFTFPWFLIRRVCLLRVGYVRPEGRKAGLGIGPAHEMCCRMARLQFMLM